MHSPLWAIPALLAPLAAFAGANETSAQSAPSNAELYEIIEAQQDRLDALEGNGSSESALSGVSIGGYGELHYNNIENNDDEIDFHRFVLFFGYEFNDRISFFSEFELEHALAGEGKEGEIELEQAYIDFKMTDQLNAKGGLFLVPVGILNETHEPPTFYGVERNNVEKNIVPTTWWEAGAAVSGRNTSGMSWDLAIHSGLKTPIDGSNAYKIRNGRQKVSEANANDPAITGRVKYSGIPGLELAATAQWQRDVTQGQNIEGTSATLIEAHAKWQRGAFGATALYAVWSLDGDAAEAVGRDEQSGGYLEGSYKICNQIGVFARYSTWDNEAGNSADTDWEQIDIGLNYWPHEDVVIKADVFDAEQNSDNDSRGFNLGIGFQFGS